MFNIPEPEIHDRVIITSFFFFFPREAEASSTAGNLLHFQIASPASPLETVPFLHLTCLWILRQEAAPRGSKEPARDSPAPRLVSSISLLQQGGRGAVPAPHPHRLGVSKLSECTGLALLQPGSATGTMLGVCASTHQCLSQPLLKRTAPGALLNQTGRGSHPLQPGSKSLHLESATGRAPREAVCFASSIPGQPWQLGEDGHTVLHLCSRTALQILLASIGGNKQCLETKRDLNCWDKHAATHKNALL